MEVFVVDNQKLELLDKMLIDLDRSFGAAPPDVKTGDGGHKRCTLPAQLPQMRVV
jgi:hypothetical protein